MTEAERTAISSEACEVPFIEQLRSVPKDYRTCVAIQWSEDGRETGHLFIPVGFMMHRAADEIERLTALNLKIAAPQAQQPDVAGAVPPAQEPAGVAPTMPAAQKGSTTTGCADPQKVEERNHGNDASAGSTIATPQVALGDCTEVGTSSESGPAELATTNAAPQVQVGSVGAPLCAQAGSIPALDGSIPSPAVAAPECVSDDFVRVPREPTEEMAEVGAKELGHRGGEPVCRAYRAMLSAAPAAQASELKPTCDCALYNGGQCYNCLNGAHHICGNGQGKCSLTLAQAPAPENAELVKRLCDEARISKGMAYLEHLLLEAADALSAREQDAKDAPDMYVAIVRSETDSRFTKLEYTKPDFGGNRVLGRYACYLLNDAMEDRT